jgi:hypothetical protein
MGNHSYKMIEAVRMPDLRVLRFNACSPEEMQDAGALAIKLRKLRYISKDAVLSFHHKSFMIRELKLPKKDDFQRHKYIHEEMLQYQTDFKEEYDYDYLILPETDSTGHGIATTAAVARSINREYIDRAIRLGLKLKAVDVQINSFLRVIHTLTERCRELSPSSAYLLLDLGYHNTTIAIAYSGKVYAPKVISEGCKNPNLSDYLLPVVNSCNNMINNFTHSFAEIPLQQGFLYGGGVYMPGIMPYIRNNIALNLSDMSTYQKYFPEIPSDCDLNLFANCFGSLLREDNAG